MTAHVPGSWAALFHRQGARRGESKLAWHPGYRGTGQQPIARVPVGRYTSRITSVPLTGGQAQGVISSDGTLTLQVGPQGMGTIWYPIQVTTTTSTGALDTSTAYVYLGPAITPATQVGIISAGNGTAALAIPNMSPGQTLIVQWVNGHPGDTASMNVIGTMDALAA